MLTTQAPSTDQAALFDRLLARAEERDGIAPLDEAAVFALHGRTPAAHALLMTEDAALAYANLLPDGTVQGVVDPEHRRQGHARLLLAELDQHVAGLVSPPTVSVWAHGDLPPARAFLRGQGLAPVRLLLELERGLSEPIPTSTPRDERITLAGIDPERDAEALLALNAAAFADHPEQGALDREGLELRFGEPWFDPEDLHVARRGSELAGFVWMKQQPGQSETEVYVVATAPAAQGSGIARALLTRALDRSRENGARSATLFVEGDNAPALGLYERLGFTERSRHVQYREA